MFHLHPLSKMAPGTPDPFSKLMLSLSALNVDKYGAFKVINTNYKTVDQIGTAIRADILIPRTLLSKSTVSPSPIIVRIHGGFLVQCLLFAIDHHDAVCIDPHRRSLAPASIPPGSQIGFLNTPFKTTPSLYPQATASSPSQAGRTSWTTWMISGPGYAVAL